MTMLHKIQIIVGLTAIFAIFNVQANWSYVYCTKLDGSDWHWLTDDAEDYMTINGNWGIMQVDGTNFSYFNVSEHDYEVVNTKCQSTFSAEHVAQPGNSSASSWSIFQVTLPSGVNYFAQGRLVRSNSPGCSPLSVICPIRRNN